MPGPPFYLTEFSLPYCPHNRAEEIEAEGGEVTYLKGTQLEGGELGCEPGGMGPEPSFPEPLYHGALWHATGLHHNEQK